MAKCYECHQEMQDKVGCTLTIFDDFADKITRKRILFNDEELDYCHDCLAPKGKLHHPGCDDERCPKCGGQAIGCYCTEEKW